DVECVQLATAVIKLRPMPRIGVLAGTSTGAGKSQRDDDPTHDASPAGHADNLHQAMGSTKKVLRQAIAMSEALSGPIPPDRTSGAAHSARRDDRWRTSRCASTVSAPILRLAHSTTRGQRLLLEGCRAPVRHLETSSGQAEN